MDDDVIHPVRTDIPEAQAALLQPLANGTTPPYQDALVELIGRVSKRYLDAHPGREAKRGTVLIDHVDPEGETLLPEAYRETILRAALHAGMPPDTAHPMIRIRHGAVCAQQVRDTGRILCTCRPGEWAVETDAAD